MQEYEAGGIYVTITADDSQLIKAFEEDEKRAKQFETNINKITTTKVSAGIKTLSDRVKESGTNFDTTSSKIRSYKTKIDELTNSYDRQSDKVMELENKLNTMRKQFIEMEQAVGRTASDTDIENFLGSSLDEYQAELDKLSAIEAKLQDVNIAYDQYIAKSQAAEESKAIKQQTSDAKLGLSTVSTAMRTLDTVTGGALGTITEVASQIDLLKQAMSAGKSTGMVLGAAITGGIGIAATVISGIVSAISEAKRKQEELINTALENSQSLNQEIDEYRRNIETINSATASADALASARDNIISQYPDLVLGYTEEGDAILAGNEALRERLELLEENTQANDRTASLAISDSSLGDLNKYKYRLKYMKEIEQFSKDRLEGKVTGTPADNGIIKPDEAGFWWSAPSVYRKEAQKFEKSQTDYYRDVQEELTEVERDYYEQFSKISDAVNSDLNSRINNYYKLSDTEKTVANYMKESAAERLMAAEDLDQYYDILFEEVNGINSVLSDDESLQKMYKEARAQDPNYLISEFQTDLETYLDYYAETYKQTQEEIYNSQLELIENELQARKDAIQEQYDLQSESLSAQLAAAQQLSFDITSLDESQLEKKRSNAEFEIELETDKNAKIILQNQLRYYDEAEQIIRVNNLRVSEYQAALDALDAADAAAEEARRQRQNEKKIKDIEDEYSSTQAEQERKLLEFDEEYAAKRKELLEIIEKPPSNTARILAEEELAELEKQYNDERQAMLLENNEALNEIQERLDEEKLTQKEEAEELERQNRRELLQEQINDIQAAAEEELANLAEKYERENIIRQDSLTAQSEQLKAKYESDLAAAEEHYNALKEQAESTYNEMISAQKVAEAQEKLLYEKSFAEIEQLASEHAQKMKEQGKSVAESFISGMREGMEDVPVDVSQEAYATYGQGVMGMTGSTDAMLDYETWALYTRLGKDVWKELRERLNIPEYGSGGYVTRPHLAIVGDEPEWIIPERKLSEFISAMLAPNPYIDQTMEKAYSYMQLPGGSTLSYTTDNSKVERSTTINIDTIELSSDIDLEMFMSSMQATIEAVGE